MDILTELRAIPLLEGASAEALDEIARLVRPEKFPAGAIVFERGDPGDTMSVILNGQAEVALDRIGDVYHHTIHLNQSDVFGEMALLTGEPRSARVRALTELELLSIDQDAYARITALVPEVNRRLLRLLAARLGVTIRKGEEEHAEARDMAASLLGRRQLPDSDPFPPVTEWARRLRATIERLADTETPFWIAGESGTGRKMVAELIHFGRSGSTARPLFIFDCADPPPVLRQARTSGEEAIDPVLLEAAQEAALFGHEPGSAIFARGTRHGYLELAHGGTLVLVHPDRLRPAVQRRLAQFRQSGTFRRLGEDAALSSRVRLVATSEKMPRELAEQGSLLPELAEVWAGEVITIPPLRKRKREIPLLAAHFLTHAARKAGKPLDGFTREAMNALVDYDWPYNTNELRQVVERAALLCRSGKVGREHIFLDLTPYRTEGRFDLLRLKFLTHLLRWKWFPGTMRWVTTLFMLVVIPLLLWGPQQDNPANIFAWGILWPLMLVTVILTARGWCACCPFSAVADGLARLFRRPAAPPGWLRKYGLHLGIAGFVLIIGVESATHMTEHPALTAGLLLSILFLALLTALWTGPRTWCLYLCPLGKAVSQLSAVSLVELRGNGNVCLASCKTHDCLGEGVCAMGLHPSAERTRQDCVFCLECIRVCPHHAVHLDLLLPETRVYNMAQWWNLPRALFTGLLYASVPAIRLPDRLWPIWQDLRPHQLVPEFGVFILTLCLFFALLWLASWAPTRAGRRSGFLLASYAYLPMVVFGLFNIYFRHFVEQGHRILPLTVRLTGLSPWLREEWVRPELATLRLLFPVMTLVGCFLSLKLLKTVAAHQPLDPAIRRRHRLLLLGSAVLFLVIL